jgi:hypothetical protein
MRVALSKKEPFSIFSRSVRVSYSPTDDSSRESRKKHSPFYGFCWDSRSITFSCRLIWCAPIEMHILSKKSLFGELFLFVKHRSNMEVDLQSLFGLNVHTCTHWLRPRCSPPPPAFGLVLRGRYWSAKIDDISL